MNIQYVIVEIDRSTGELRIGFSSCDKIILMSEFFILGTKKIANKFYSMSTIKRVIKRLEKHHESMKKSL